MTDCLVIVGREEALGLAELGAVVEGTPTAVTPHLVRMRLSSPEALASRAGSVVKVARIHATCSEATLVSTLVSVLQRRAGKIIFGISVYGEDALRAPEIARNTGSGVKTSLTSAGRAVRFVVSRAPQLSSVSVSKEKLLLKGVEFVLVRSGDQWVIGETVAIQDFRAWASRDYGKPVRFPRVGMLPPKLARMMVNLSGAPSGGTILDPFCGSGSILMEALLLGFRAIGADANPTMVAGAKKNLEWLSSSLLLSKEGREDWHIIQSDARAVSSRVKGTTVDALVTEPYLGPPLKGREGARALMETKKRLEELYTAALKDWEKIIKKGGTLVLAFPVFRLRGAASLTVNDAVYEPTAFRPAPLLSPSFASRFTTAMTPRGGILYGRPGQHVWREIIKFHRQ